MRNARCYIFLLVFVIGNSCYSQSNTSLFEDSSKHYFWICKMRISIPLSRVLYKLESKAGLPTKKKEIFSVNGELSYQYFDRNSSSDDLLLINSSSHIATARISVVYKEIYPFDVSFRFNKASPFQLDNQYELNIGSNDRSFRQLLMERIKKNASVGLLEKQEQVKQAYTKNLALYHRQKQILESPVTIQKAVEERMKINKTLPKLPEKPSLKDVNTKIPDLAKRIDLPEKMEGILPDSGLNATIGKANTFYQQQLKKKDSLEKVLHKFEDSLSALKNQLNRKLDSVEMATSSITSNGDLKRYAGKNFPEDSLPENKWADLLMRTNLRLGKFLLSNSELTVSNIFLHGASLKYGEEKFIMVSGGFYDFSFRRVFNFRNDTIPRHRPTVFAIKIGKTDGRNLSAFSFYTGKKTSRGAAGNELVKVSGVSLEKKIFLNDNFSLELEIAKSTTLKSDPAQKTEGTIRDLFGSFNGRTIGAYGSGKINLPKTHTDAEISYRYWGQQFQSFNASQYFNPNNNLEGKITQPFFKRALFLTAGGKYTDFKSFGITNNIHTKTLFASFNSTIRIKKLPIISLGYYPGSQLYWMEQDKLYEYFYYIVNATAIYHFRAGGIPMQTVITYNKFLNKYSDSAVKGAQYYYNAYWTAWKDNFSYTVNYSRQETDDQRLHTFEGGLSFSNDIFKLGGSIKYNLMEGSDGIGYAFNAGVKIRRLGTVNLVYDKSFLPDRRGAFIPVSMGQVQIIKPLKFSVWQQEH
jgi:hypothetical protein